MTDSSVAGVIYWFRNDLRLHDAPALRQAIALAQAQRTWLLPVCILDTADDDVTPWGFQRVGLRRRFWHGRAVQGLSRKLADAGSRLHQYQGDPVQVLLNLAQALQGSVLVCEDIAAPQEQHQLERLRRQGVRVHAVWQSSLMDPGALPFSPENVPDVFTQFRQLVEKQGVQATPPEPAVVQLPALPSVDVLSTLLAQDAPSCDPRSAFPWADPAFDGSEQAALAHVAHYVARGLPHTYKVTRNGLIGADYSTKWSPWLATGALSPRQAWAAIQAFEQTHGANESTYWIGFELLWRDHFRWLHHKHGVRLYRAQGLTKAAPPAHDEQAFGRWCRGETGQPFIDAGMRELARTGYLSNRMRQIVASYLIHDLQCDWRAGAAWFEAMLIDYDVYSNQGNWLYLSGRGTDPRGARRFNPDKQARDHDPLGRYQSMWAREHPESPMMAVRTH